MRIDSYSNIVVTPTRGSNVPELSVPMSLADKRSSVAGLDLFTTGVVWEDKPYALSFDLTTTAPIRRATISVNDHEDLRLPHSTRSMWVNGMYLNKCSFWTDEYEDGYFYTHPFALSCGFVRMVVRIEFRDGHSEELVSQDVVALDEPQKKGPSGPAAEEDNVRRMIGLLTKAEQNQAAEWMFSKQARAPMGGALSSDGITDWANESVAARLQTASDALDLIYDGLEDPSDAFPNVVDACEQRNGLPPIGPHDTAQNRAVRALLTSMERQVGPILQRLKNMHDESTQVLEQINQLVYNARAVRGRRQSMPALAMFATWEARERELMLWADDIAWRISEAVRQVFVEEDGMGPVEDVPFEVPERTGLFATDATYASLRSAMEVWDRFAHQPMGRMELGLHAIKPDKLFEYAALHKLLSWLHEEGFLENAEHQSPIGRYSYALANEYYKYSNEERCANTYWLARPATLDPHGLRTEVTLLYQPVIYADSREENDIELHRVDVDGEDRGGFWTPDYLLVVAQEGKPERTYLMDAKYVAYDKLQGKLYESVRKYKQETSRHVGGPPGEGVDGVVLLSGRLGTARLRRIGSPDDEEGFLCVIAPFHTRMTRGVLDELFELLGVSKKE